MSVFVTVKSELKPGLRALTNSIEGEGRGELNEAMGTEVALVTVAHIRDLAQSRHATANRLGAAPSGFLEGAADAVSTAANASSVSVIINHPGFGRAFHDVTITPKTAKALAIPIAAVAYNRRPAQLTLEGHKLFVLGGKGHDVGKNILAEKQPDGSLLLLYILVRSVTQKQDRSLLPSDEEWQTAAAQGARRYIRTQIAAAGLS